MAALRSYFDTSVLVKRWVLEQDSGRARRLLASRAIVSSAITPVELAAAVCRRHAAGDLTAKQRDAILADLQRERAGWDLVAVGRLVTDRAEDVIRTTGVRALDALHLASALLLRATVDRPMPFVTADAEQAEAAERLGLEVLSLA